MLRSWHSGYSVHTTQMLSEQILSIEVVIHRMVDTRRRRTHVAPPKAELDMLSADVTLPFVFGSERRAAIVLRKAAWKRACTWSRNSVFSWPWRGRNRFRWPRHWEQL